MGAFEQPFQYQHGKYNISNLFKITQKQSSSLVQGMLHQRCVSDWKKVVKVCMGVLRSGGYSLFHLECKQWLLPLTVPRPHRYERNSNWVRNVWWANGRAMLWLASAVFSLREGLFGLHLKGCVCGGDADKDQGESDSGSHFRDWVIWTYFS